MLFDYKAACRATMSSHDAKTPHEEPGLRARPPRPLRGVPAKEIRRFLRGIAPLLHRKTLRSMTGKALPEKQGLRVS